MDMLHDPRFAGIEPFQSKLWFSSPTMHGDEQKWVDDAITTNWVSTVGANINEIEKLKGGGNVSSLTRSTRVTIHPARP